MTEEKNESIILSGILNKVLAALKAVPCIRGIVLGGSRATGTSTASSDIDIGIYYDRESLNYEELNSAAKLLDDEHRSELVCREGQWGNWVNFGGWLSVDGIHVDLIFRDVKRVEKVMDDTDSGHIEPHYQTGHPHAYIDVMYRGELAVSKLLYSSDSRFDELKHRAEDYPDNLRNALIGFFGFEAGFSLELAEKSAKSGDIYYVSGHIFRSVSAINQVIFALNRQWCLNEKKAVFRIDGFQIKPDNYSQRINSLFSGLCISASASLAELHGLLAETQDLID